MASLRNVVFWELTILILVLQSCRALQLAFPPAPPLIDKNLNLSWTLRTGDPANFNVDALCNNVTIPLRLVNGRDGHVSLPAIKLPSAAHRNSPYSSCVFRARNVSNNAVLASSSPFVVLSADNPTSSVSGPSPTASHSLPLSPSRSAIASSTGPIFSSVPALPSNSMTLTSASLALSPSMAFSAPAQLVSTEGQDAMLNMNFDTSVIPLAAPTSLKPGFTDVERTSTITFVSQSSTSIMTLTFTSQVPVQSADAPPAKGASPSRVLAGAIVGGLLGGLTLLFLLIGACVIIRRRNGQRRQSRSMLIPLAYDEGYTQPVEKSARVNQRVILQLAAAHVNPVRAQMDVEAGDQRSRHPNDLPQDKSEARRLRQKVQRMSERIMELEAQQREVEIYTGWKYTDDSRRPPPDYGDPESQTIMSHS